MDMHSIPLSEKSIRFVQTLFKIYLEDRDFTCFISMLDDDISWFGTGAHEVCENFDEAVALIEAERDSWDSHFKILEQNYWAHPLGEKFCMVCGELRFVEDGLNTFLLEMYYRISLVCHFRQDGTIKLYNAHFSVPNVAQTETEFLHKSVMDGYNLLLEEKLEERTKLLKSKSFELETITNNIEAAILRCDFDDRCTVSFANDGFYRMVGYTRQQFLEEHANSLSALVHAHDVAAMKESFKQQLSVGDSTVHVARIFQRDGSSIWILAKGTVRVKWRNKLEFHGVLTDITEQKKQEEALQISEKRYEIAMQLCDATMFEYNLLTKQLILPGSAAQMYHVPLIVDDGVETFIRQRIIEPDSAQVYRELYAKIHRGVPTAKAFVNAKSDGGAIHEYELSLTNVFDSSGKSIRAIGVRRNVTEMRRLEKEKNYGETLASVKYFVCEANITKDILLRLEPKWAEEFGGAQMTSFFELMVASCEYTVESAYQEMVQKQLSKSNIESAFENGQHLLSFVYRKKVKDYGYHWFEATINIIKDGTTGDINIRFYTVDINDQKEKEHKILDEQRLYETMVTKSLIAYEVNVTKNITISWHENWYALFGVEKTNQYSKLIEDLCEKAVHPEDRENFQRLFSCENVLHAFQKGERELICEYRRSDEEGEFIWMRCSLHLYEDLIMGDVKGYSYVENIHEQKQAQLELIYKSEHDVLTGLYNKSTTEKLIDEFLTSSSGKNGKHAYIIMDIDHFKDINDNFGHAFGDAILSQISSKIRDLFRDDDIVGRIGGDEFVVLMKHIPSSKIAMAKSEEICAVLSETYTQNGKDYKVTASVGIALYNKHGKNYSELYRHSDSALYAAKRNGRDCFCLYHEKMEMAETEIKEIDTRLLLDVKTFEENITEYVFRILYESPDKRSAVHAVLNLVGKHYNVSRAYIFEESSDGRFISNTFEWCNMGVEAQIHELQNLSYSDLAEYQMNFGDNGIFYMSDIAKMSDHVKQLLESQDIKSMVQFAILRNGKFSGFIGFDECRYVRIPSRAELTEINNISNLLGLFITEMRAIEQSESMKNMAMSIVNGLDSYAYVCDPRDFTVLFINNKTMEIAPNAKVGDFCYKAFWNRNVSCVGCPMRELEKRGEPRYVTDMYNTNLDVFVRASASWIDWIGGHRVCLVDSVNITQYKAFTKT